SPCKWFGKSSIHVLCPHFSFSPIRRDGALPPSCDSDIDSLFVGLLLSRLERLSPTRRPLLLDSRNCLRSAVLQAEARIVRSVMVWGKCSFPNGSSGQIRSLTRWVEREYEFKSWETAYSEKWLSTRIQMDLREAFCRQNG